VFKSTVKGDIGSNLITWIIGIFAAIVIVFWFVSNNPFAISGEIDRLNEDLREINEKVMRACNMMHYEASYNPLTEAGTIELYPSEICIRGELKDQRSLRRCVTTFCNISTQDTYDLRNTTYITIQKDGNITIGWQ